MTDDMKRDAHISTCGLYRYTLTRCWRDDRPSLVFVMLNPSTADAETDDATIRRCIGLSKDRGFGSFTVVNLCAFRARHPRDMRSAQDPVGPANIDSVQATCATADRIVAAWGVHGNDMANRDPRVKKIMEIVHASGKTVSLAPLTLHGAPRHPLYVRSDVQFLPWGESAAWNTRAGERV